MCIRDRLSEDVQRVVAHDQRDDTLHVLAEHYQAGRTLRQHVAAIHAMCAAGDLVALDSRGRPELAWAVADPEDKQSRVELAYEYGLTTVPAHKAVRDGINAVAERLEPDVAGKPHLLVHARCVHLIREFEGYVWDPAAARSGGDQKDAPLKREDHAMDTLRYVCAQVRRGAPISAS